MLLLDTILFSELEIPEHIRHGGRHTLSVTTDVGGKRHVDAMGPDDAPIRWNGRLQGADAAARSQALQALKDSGREVVLMWANEMRLGVVNELDLSHEAPYQILYRLEFLVSSNPLRDNAPTDIALSLASAVGLDIGVTAALLPTVTSLVPLVSPAIDAVQALALDTANVTQLSELVPTLASAIDATRAISIDLDTKIVLTPDQTTMPQLINDLIGIGDALDMQIAAIQIDNALTRAKRNIANAVG